MTTGIDSYAAQLRKLTEDYYNQLISMQDYRQQRKQILDEIDAEFNHNSRNVSEKDFVS